MAKPVASKIFNKDLSNYAEIRRGLTPEWRKLTPTKKQLQSISPDVKDAFIQSLNDWRALSIKDKTAHAKALGSKASLFFQTGASKYLSTSERVEVLTAGLKLRAERPDLAKWDLREAVNMVDRTHGHDWYVAHQYLDDDKDGQQEDFNPEQATDSMLVELLEDPQGLDENTFDSIMKEYFKRTFPNATPDEIEQMVAEQRPGLMAGYYGDLLIAARTING